MAQALRNDFPDIRLLILSMYVNQKCASAAVSIRAQGYVLKDAPSREIVVAIEAIASGGTYYSDGIAEKLASRGVDEP